MSEECPLLVMHLSWLGTGSKWSIWMASASIRYLCRRYGPKIEIGDWTNPASQIRNPKLQIGLAQIAHAPHATSPLSDRLQQSGLFDDFCELVAVLLADRY